MFRGIGRIFTHRYAGVAWSLSTLALAATLMASHVEASRKEEFLKSRIAALASGDASRLQAELVSCRASARTERPELSVSEAPRERRPGETTKVNSMSSDPARRAAELADNAPAGFDVCARMESADQAVLKALDRR